MSASRNIVLISLTRLISELGSVAIRFALSLYILDATSSPLASGVVFAVTYIPSVLVNIFAGVWIDRSNKKKVLVVTDMLSGVLTLLFLAAFYLFKEHMALIVVYVLVLYTLQAIFALAMNASVPEMVPEDKVMTVNSNIQSIGALVNILGIFLGASVYILLGLEMIILIDGITFLISGLLSLYLVFWRAPSREEGTKKAYMDSLKEVYAYMLTKKALKYLLLVFIAVNFLLTPLITVVLLYIVRDAFEMIGYEMAFIEAAFGVGVIAGALLVAMKRVSEYVTSRIFMLIQLTAVTILCWLIPALPFVAMESKIGISALFMVLLLAAGMFNIMANIPMMSYVQIYIPEKIRASVLGVVTTVTTTSVPIGMLLFGALMEVVSWSALVAVSGTLLLIIGYLAHRNSNLREFFSKGTGVSMKDSIHPSPVKEAKAVQTKALQ